MKCEKCGSEFELTKHHYTKTHLNHKEKKTEPVNILCVTCHELEDFWKNIKCKEKSELKKYYSENNKKLNNPHLVKQQIACYNGRHKKMMEQLK